MTRIEKLNAEIREFEAQIKDRREAVEQVQAECPHPEGLLDVAFRAEEDEYGSTQTDPSTGRTHGYLQHECHLCGKSWVEEDKPR